MQLYRYARHASATLREKLGVCRNVDKYGSPAAGSAAVSVLGSGRQPGSARAAPATSTAVSTAAASATCAAIVTKVSIAGRTGASATERSAHETLEATANAHGRRPGYRSARQ